MKNKFVIFISGLMMLSCSREIPEDIHEHEEANRLVVTYSEVGTTVEKVAEFNIGTGASVPIDLENGKIYNVDVEFFHDDEDLTHEIEEEIEEHFMKYIFSDINVNVVRTAADPTRNDGNKLGIHMTWTVNSVPSATSKVNMQLIHGATTVDDSTNNGAGSSTGGEPDIDVTFNIQ